MEKNFIVADVGANIGYYTRLFSLLAGPGGKVFAFEPETDNFLRLQKSGFPYPNVEINKMAVGEKSEKKFMYVSDKYNVDHRMYPDVGNTRKIPVNVVALDDFFTDRYPDVIKMDIQGYEYFALKGMEKIRKESDRLAIFFEFWPYGILKSGALPENVLEMFPPQEWHVFFMSGSSLKSIRHPHFLKIKNNSDVNGYCNLVALKGNHVEKIQNLIFAG